MIVYIDSSVLLRIVLQQAEPLEQWNEIKLGVSSAVLRVECQRALDRIRHERSHSDAAVSMKRAAIDTAIARMKLLEIDARVLDLAAQPYPTRIATLDALHLATAILYRSNQPPDEPPILFATHDRALAKAATAMQFQVVGI